MLSEINIPPHRVFVTLGSGANVFLGNVTNNTTVNSLKLVTLGDASINGNLFINKDLNVTGNLSVNQYQTKQTITTLNYQLQVVEDLSINGRLFLNGNATISGTTNLGGSFVSSGSNLHMVNSTLSSTIGNDFALFQGTAGDTVINSKSGQSLQLKINNTEYMRVHSDGKVGIGTNNPQATLDVNVDAIIGNTYIGSGDYLRLIHKTLKSSINSNYALLQSPEGETVINSATSYGISFRQNNSVNRMVINSSGNVGIGTTNPSYTLDVNGELRIANTGALYTNNIRFNSGNFTIYNNNGTGVFMVYGNQSWNGNSDIRLKTNIVNIPSTLTKLLQLRPVFFNWKSNLDGPINKGFIAQEVEEMFPELISEIYNESLNDNTKALSLTDFIPYMVKGMQEQQVLIQSQQTQIDALIARLAAAGIA